MFLLRLLWHQSSAPSSTCTDVSSMKGEKKSQTIFVLSLNCHQQSAESACRDWDLAEGCRAQEQRPPTQLPKATSCPKGKGLHFLLRRNTCINVISFNHKAALQQHSHLTALFSCEVFSLIVADLMAAVEGSGALGAGNKQNPCSPVTPKQFWNTEWPR